MRRVVSATLLVCAFEFAAAVTGDPPPKSPATPPSPAPEREVAAPAPGPVGEKPAANSAAGRGGLQDAPSVSGKPAQAQQTPAASGAPGNPRPASCTSASEAGSSDWWKIIAGFGLGLLGALGVEWWKHWVRDRRSRTGIQVEVERVRVWCVAVRWSIAESTCRRTTDLARLMMSLAEADPLAASRMGPGLDELRKMAHDDAACRAANAAPAAPKLPPPVPTPVFTANAEALGALGQDALRAVWQVQAALPGVTETVKEMQNLAWALATAFGQVNIERAEAQLAQHMETLDDSARVLHGRTEEALKQL